MTPSLRRPLRLVRVAGALVLAASITLAGCSDQGIETPTSPSEVLSPQARSGPPLVLQQQDLGPALAAQRRHGPRLMARPAVVGHGVGMVNGEPGIRVFLLSPDVAGIPSRLDDVPVAVEVTGMFVAGDLDDPQTLERPAPNGFSIGHPDITAGTLGAVVIDGGGICYALSNNHVLANSNNASIGDASLQPGPYDGGQNPADAIGTLADFKPIAFDGSDNDIDAAISRLFEANDVTAATPSYAYGAPSADLVEASVDQPVQKFGRTTGLSAGTVEVLNVTVSICYECLGPFCKRCKRAATFTDQIATSDMSDGGDSGSLIVTHDGNNDPVGLLFAGSSTRTIANPIENVLTYFGVSIETNTSNCTNGSGSTNIPPTASFTYTCTDLDCVFDGSGSSDSDGSISSFEWDFGDGNRGTGSTGIHTYAAGGSYPVTLAVTDNDGATDSSTQDVTVTEPTSRDITLSASGYKIRGVRYVDLLWSGASTTTVDIWRNGSIVMPATANDGEETDNLGRNSGTYIYQICEADTTTCSNEAVVTF